MTLQNRVLPTGEIVASPARGRMMGNRGILHDGNRQLGAARWTHRAWISCVLDFNGRRRTVMTPGRYTELFFLDESVAMAAGHRPCGECRRARYREFMRLWSEVCADLAPAKPKEVDRILHAARVDPATKKQRRFSARFDTVPHGAHILRHGAALLVYGSETRLYGPEGYSFGPAVQPIEIVDVLTPEPLVRVLRAGYRPELAPL